MTKRERIKNKYGGLCAYTGQPLGDDWQIDHVTPKNFIGRDDPNADDNLVPCLRIVNHYKREQTLEQFRRYIATLQERIDKLPVWYKRGDIIPDTLPLHIRRQRERTVKRAEYIKRVAALFGITPDTPFDGKFWFEKYIETF